ncbi:hypothetical protein O181_002434 [Austropuccinia psidii MF-1]|uniref:Uncharacterized protein n=1 Tax=Austropuccinia psidii MF-1 TaxID=1389203 RepID=A0A9Q3BC95_9BASI|nr:hypothetical protein [Austropuccinia psidii MF-1]
MIIAKGWNPNRNFRLLDNRSARIRRNQATIKEIEEMLNQKEHTLTPLGSQGVVSQPDSPVASSHSRNRRSVAKGHHDSKSQVVSRR